METKSKVFIPKEKWEQQKEDARKEISLIQIKEKIEIKENTEAKE